MPDVMEVQEQVQVQEQVKEPITKLFVQTMKNLVKRIKMVRLIRTLTIFFITLK